jgi:hypothetical protein
MLFSNVGRDIFIDMASMEDPLAKLARANEHIDQFERETRSLVNPNSYNVIVETDSSTGNENWYFKSSTPVVPLRLSAIAGDTLFNLRSALDQIVWQLVLANNGEPSRNNCFPIFIAHEFDRRIKKNSSLKGVSKAAVQIIKECQPKPGYNWELLFLPKLNDIDKHRRLHMCVVYIKSATATFDDSSVSATGNEDIVEAFQADSYENLKDGTILFSIPKKYRTKFYNPRFEIKLTRDSGISLNEPVLEMLKNMSKQVKAIFSALENEVTRR